MRFAIRQQADEGVFRRLAQNIGANIAHDPLAQTAPLMGRLPGISIFTVISVDFHDFP